MVPAVFTSCMAGVVVLGLAQAARTDDQKKPRDRVPPIIERLKAADADGDGKISKDEAPERLRQAFDRLDSNGDGRLDAGELEQLAARFGQGGRGRQDRPDAAAMIQRLMSQDADGDGRISKDEAPERLKARFDQIDADGDGKLDSKELKQAFARAQGGGRAESSEGPMALLARLKQADADGDGKLSKDEAPEPLATRFDALDTDGDGFIDAKEIEPLVARLKQAGRTPQEGGMMARFKAVDKNNDGKLSKDEVPELPQDRFDRIDADSDGSIDGEELKQAMDRRRQG